MQTTTAQSVRGRLRPSSLGMRLGVLAGTTLVLLSIVLTVVLVIASKGGEGPASMATPAPAAWERHSLWLGILAGGTALTVVGLTALLDRHVRILHAREHRFREVESHLNRAQSIAQMGSWEWNLQTNRMWWSRELHHLFDLPDDAEPPSYGRFLQAVHPDDRAVVANAVARALDNGQGFSIDYRVRRTDGRDRHVRHEGQCVLDAQGSPTRMDAVIQDNTEHTNLQARLAQAGKLSTLGEMAAGMAHELSQPLNILRMATEGALLRLDHDSHHTIGHEALRQVSDQADRMARIIDHIRIFSRKDTAPTHVFDARASVRLAADMMAPHLAAASIRLDMDLPDRTMPVKGRPAQLEQVLVNLLSNAKDAIAERRSRENGNDDDPEPTGQMMLHMRSLSGSVEISLHDDGIGVSPGLFGRIFEPFFTTKSVGEGTGLGLSVSYGIITGMGGTLSATNRRDGGASFEIILPLHGRTENDSSLQDDPHHVRGTDTVSVTMETDTPRAPHVLLVEDEPATLTALRDHVTRLGFRVSTADGGEQAWKRFVGAPADLVVTDLHMAGDDGAILVRRLREVDPFLPIVIVADRSHEAPARPLPPAAQDPNTRVLSAPLNWAALDETMNSLLCPSA